MHNDMSIAGLHRFCKNFIVFLFLLVLTNRAFPSGLIENWSHTISNQCTEIGARAVDIEVDEDGFVFVLGYRCASNSCPTVMDEFCINGNLDVFVAVYSNEETVELLQIINVSLSDYQDLPTEMVLDGYDNISLLSKTAFSIAG